MNLDEIPHTSMSVEEFKQWCKENIPEPEWPPRCCGILMKQRDKYQWDCVNPDCDIIMSSGGMV